MFEGPTIMYCGTATESRHLPGSSCVLCVQHGGGVVLGLTSSAEVLVRPRCHSDQWRLFNLIMTIRFFAFGLWSYFLITTLVGQDPVRA